MTGMGMGRRMRLLTPRPTSHGPRERRQTLSGSPRPAKVGHRGQRTKPHATKAGAFFVGGSSRRRLPQVPPPAVKAGGHPRLVNRAVGTYRCRRGPDGPRDHHPAPGWRSARRRSARTGALPGTLGRVGAWRVQVSEWGDSASSRPDQLDLGVLPELDVELLRRRHVGTGDNHRPDPEELPNHLSEGGLGPSLGHAKERQIRFM